MSTLRPLEEIERDHGMFARQYVQHGTPLARLLADIPALVAAIRRFDEHLTVCTHERLTADLARVTAERDAFRAMTVRLREHLARWHGYSSPDYYGTGRLLTDAERLLKESDDGK